MTQRYDTYKDSGVQWLGEIPGHWKAIPVRRIAQVNPSKKKELSPDDYVGYAPMERIRCDQMIPTRIKVSQLTSGLTYCEQGDIVLAKVTPCFENGNLAIVPKVENGCCYASSELFVFRPKTNVLDRFLFYTFLNRSFIDAGASTMRGTGGLKRVTTEFANTAATPLPPLSEQHSIVSYLDDKCGKIDKMLEGKQKQIELLAEMKQRIIADAVTHGLNPDVKMKATNIPWLPEIPEHWDVKRGKNLFNKEQRPIEEGDEIVTCFRDGEVTLRKKRRTTGFTEATDYSHYQHICKGDLVIHQMDAFAGSSGVSDSDGMGTPVLSVCTARIEGVNHYYFAYILRLMGKNNFILSLYRGIRERSSDFRFETFAKQYLPVPPAIEQEQIVKFIHERSSKIDALTSKLQQEIESIKEYKQRLISDVVTGQIKVC
ncbi:MAG: restriction endonuclease subunit S [Bacteroidaceae bacterium]|nr:restriction endonuclease subunit S [Bacteroidaceae bacterium]